MRRGSRGALDRRGFFVHGFARALGEAADALAERVAPRRYIRPPGALPEAAFVAACTRCGDCVRACPVAAIAPLGAGEGLASGTPALAPALDACIMCAHMPCAAACSTGALTRPEGGWAHTRIGALEIDTGRCIAHRDVACGICARACPVGEAALSIDAGGRPVIGDACTGCGVCISACVTTPSSITVKPPREIE